MIDAEKEYRAWRDEVGFGEHKDKNFCDTLLQDAFKAGIIRGLDSALLQLREGKDTESEKKP